MKHKKYFEKTFLFILTLCFAVISVYPLLWVILQSFKTETEFLSSIWSLPGKFRLDSYNIAWNTEKLSTFFFNSVLVTITTSVVNIVLISLAGFAFSKLHLRFKEFFYYYVIFNLLIPTSIILLPMFIQIRDLGLINTLPALVFPYFQGFAPLGLIITRNYFNDIPDELMEAAKLDGCSILQTFYFVMLPLAKPIVATMAILGSMMAWNEYMWALISITEKTRYTLSVGVAMLNDKASSIGYTPIFAALSISAMVIVLLYLTMQQYFIKSIAAGAVKG